MIVDHSGMRLGKKAAKHDDRTLLLASYLLPHLPAPPAAHTWSTAVSEWPMYNNHILGDCTIAGAAHAVQVWSANAGTEVRVSDYDVLAAYRDACGYDASDPSTDRGGVLLDVMKFWQKEGIGGHKIGAYVAVDPLSKTFTKDGIYLTGQSYIGLQLPASAQTQRVWEVPHGGARGRGAPGSWGGHCVTCVDFDVRGLTCVTWGALKRMSWGFFRAYCDEQYAIISPDFVSGVLPAPNGFDLAALQADLAAIRR